MRLRPSLPHRHWPTQPRLYPCVQVAFAVSNLLPRKVEHRRGLRAFFLVLGAPSAKRAVRNAEILRRAAFVEWRVHDLLKMFLRLSRSPLRAPRRNSMGGWLWVFRTGRHSRLQVSEKRVHARDQPASLACPLFSRLLGKARLDRPEQAESGGSDVNIDQLPPVRNSLSEYRRANSTGDSPSVRLGPRAARCTRVATPHPRA